MSHSPVPRRARLTLEPFESRLVPAGLADAFISSVYSTLLHRAVDSQGLAYWTTVDNTQGQQAVVQGVENSSESESDQVQSLYNNLLDRTSNSEEVNYWVNQLQSGTSSSQVTADVLGSSEFLNDSGNSTVGFLDQVYQKELGRPLDASGESYWGTQLASGASAQSVALGIVTSNEATQDTVSSDYQQILGRNADSVGLAYWSSIANQGNGQDSVITGMMCSGEANNNLSQGGNGSDSTTSGSGQSGETGDVATHFLILTPRYVQSGAATSLKVEALDASNQVVKDYTGTVQLSSSDTATTSGGTALPITYTFQDSDHGTHVFSVTPGTTGSETITASDTTTTSITGNVQLQVNAPAVATHFLVVVPANVEAGVATPVLVEALDASNHLVPNYTGTVQLSSSDTATTSGGTALPITYTFQDSDHGAHVFSVTPASMGTETLTASDTATTSITGSVELQVNAQAVATQLVVKVPKNVQAGVPTPVLVEALDASNHVVPSYTGTVQLTSSDADATLASQPSEPAAQAKTGSQTDLPATYTFRASDQGTHVFMVTFSTSGSPTLTATDTTNSDLTNTVTVNVGSASSSPGYGFGGPQFLVDNLFQNFPVRF